MDQKENCPNDQIKGDDATRIVNVITPCSNMSEPRQIRLERRMSAGNTDCLTAVRGMCGQDPDVKERHLHRVLTLDVDYNHGAPALQDY
jgi:hypothetical protein